MRERKNKPRVFLSHARKDVVFIERIENDLRKCQIEPWRDQNEIRDGQPWMQAIFEDGIPTCDAILAYFTENSLNSGMVEKEVDSAILRRLADNKIAFLPYVDDDKTRDKLRVDIQTLHCRVWNEENYYQILPSIVAQIWQSYLERSIENAVLQERNRRLELELEVKRLNEVQGEDVFTKREEKEFQYIFNKIDASLNASIPIHLSFNSQGISPGDKIGDLNVKFSLIHFLLKYINDGYYYFDKGQYTNFILEQSEKFYPKSKKFYPKKIVGDKISQPFEIDINLPAILVKFGLAEVQISDKPFSYPVYLFTQYMNRFACWIEYNDLRGKAPEFQYLDFIEEKN